jgi:benzoyl-CoA 2,3-dioxygenase component B
VGTTGVDRVVPRTAELMRSHDTDDVSPFGGISLAAIQKYLNFHYSVSLDLFGGETSTNVANYFTAGLKGRWQEERRDDDHVLAQAMTTFPRPDGGRIVEAELRALTALNHDLRTAYIADCQTGVTRWNRILASHGISGPGLHLPHLGFNRQVGVFAGCHITPAGQVVGAATWQAGRPSWLPTPADKAHVESLMRPVYEPGKIAAWLAPPRSGINGQPLDYSYVRF